MYIHTCIYARTLIQIKIHTPGMSDIVDFHAVAWGWGRVFEAPTPATPHSRHVCPQYHGAYRRQHLAGTRE